MLLQNAIVDALNNSEWAFPLAECVHIGGFAIAVGSIALVDFRLLNLGLRDETSAGILRYTEPWTLIAMMFVVFSGFTLFVSQVHIYLINQVFAPAAHRNVEAFSQQGRVDRSGRQGARSDPGNCV